MDLNAIHKIISEAYKPNNFTDHIQDLHERGRSHQQYSHTGIIVALKGCSTVKACGTVDRLYDDFASQKKEEFISEESDN